MQIATVAALFCKGHLKYPQIQKSNDFAITTGLDAMLIRAPSPVQEETSPNHETPTLRPDILLGLDWFKEKPAIGKNHSVVTEAISMFLGENICSQSKSVNPSGSNYALGNALGLHSFSWSNLPGTCQTSDFP